MLKYSYDASGNLVAKTVGTLLPPQIIGQPVNQVVDVGHLATFSVVVADAGGVTYQWSRNVPNPVSGFRDIPGATMDSLEVGDVGAADCGQYRVSVRNLQGLVISSIADLRLTTAPPINSPTIRLIAYADLGGVVAVQPMKRTYAVGDHVTVTAKPLSAQFVFIGWAGDLQGATNPQTLTLDRNKLVRARFASTAPIPTGCMYFWPGEADASAGSSGFGAIEYIHNNEAAFFRLVSGHAQYVANLVTTQGKVGGAFQFDGTDCAALLGGAGFDEAITLEAWIFPTTLSGIHQAVVAKGSRMGTDPTWLMGLLDGKATFWTKHGGSATLLLTAPDAIPLNVWTHLAASFDGKVKRLYVNGAEVATQVAPSFLDFANASPLINIGMLSTNIVDFASSFFSGRIDELAIYNRALTQNEIADIYNADSQGKNVKAPYFKSLSPLPIASVGIAYAQQLQTVLGASPVTFSQSAGFLPPGVALSSTDGMVSGTPTSPGTFDFTVRATDARGQFTEQLFVLLVS